jgi:quercetin dioxygenase-like cupin family protein
MPDSTDHQPSVTSWNRHAPPVLQALETALRSENLTPSWWSNAPGDTFSPHTHDYHKVLYCARGSIRFLLQPSGRALDLSPGDRLDLPAAITPSAVVGPDGVTCVESPRP